MIPNPRIELDREGIGKLGKACGGTQTAYIPSTIPRPERRIGTRQMWDGDIVSQV